MKRRCAWCGDDPLYVSYHDNEWGVPVHDDRCLFEFLILEGAQAGLSWLTILKKRENYRKAFDAFDFERIARYGRQDIARLLRDPGIVRNRLKIEAAIRNAQGVLTIREEHGSLSAFLWRYVDGVPLQNAWKCMAALPAKTKESDQMSQDLKKRGFNFVGSTICYAFMQAVGMVNDHTVDCFRHKEVAGHTPTTGGRTSLSRRR
jgi:DNA-3-methyladenine glycosylase I